MSKRTVLKVDTSCCKCKRRVMLAVTSLQGVDKVEIDSEKSTMTVTGRVDPVDVVVATRTKAGKRAAVVTIGAPPSSKPEEKKTEEKKTEEKKKPAEQHAQEKKYTYVYTAAAAERKAPEMPMTVYVHPASWPPAYYGHGVVDYHHQQQDACSIM